MCPLKTLVKILPLSLQWCMRYHVIVGHKPPDCIFITNYILQDCFTSTGANVGLPQCWCTVIPICVNRSRKSWIICTPDIRLQQQNWENGSPLPQQSKHYTTRPWKIYNSLIINILSIAWFYNSWQQTTTSISINIFNINHFDMFETMFHLIFSWHLPECLSWKYFEE